LRIFAAPASKYFQRHLQQQLLLRPPCCNSCGSAFRGPPAVASAATPGSSVQTKNWYQVLLPEAVLAAGFLHLSVLLQPTQ
ncbi:hypothetical protein CLOM_g15012, partial [Closterium sp. NIES-68]